MQEMVVELSLTKWYHVHRKLNRHSTYLSATNTQVGVKSALASTFTMVATTTMPFYYNLSLSNRQDVNGQEFICRTQKRVLGKV